ncbi:unnamed protein product [Fraxinus pennsylvanica]|uniref:Uncharacterized protein n=1 Tax=Fraxinus pennsylvanica TaxID=56036 RepID=A0AAD1ZVR8_9LAMI|nr:unnamed protein product [Fraxinus pennsylvanica]
MPTLIHPKPNSFSNPKISRHLPSSLSLFATDNTHPPSLCTLSSNVAIYGDPALPRATAQQGTAAAASSGAWLFRRRYCGGACKNTSEPGGGACNSGNQLSEAVEQSGGDFRLRCSIDTDIEDMEDSGAVKLDMGDGDNDDRYMRNLHHRCAARLAARIGDTIEKIKKAVDEGNYFVAQQMYKSFSARYTAAGRYLDALNILQSGACLQLVRLLSRASKTL